MKFDITQAMEMSDMGRVRTRNGRGVRILCVDLKNAQPIVAAVFGNGYESIEEYSAKGTYHIDGKKHPLDLNFVS